MRHTLLLLLFMAGCGNEVVHVSLATQAMALRPEAVRSYDLWVLHGQTTNGGALSCETFVDAGLPPVTRGVSVLIPPVVGGSLVNAAELSVKGIPPSAVDRIFLLRLFDGENRTGAQIGVACNQVNIPPGSRIALDLLVL